MWEFQVSNCRSKRHGQIFTTKHTKHTKRIQCDQRNTLVRIEELPHRTMVTDFIFVCSVCFVVKVFPNPRALMTHLAESVNRS